jgi:uncharacterized phage protein gp47/JayE
MADSTKTSTTIPEFSLPEFLEDMDADSIHDEMMASLPADIDRAEGGFPWDFTRPTALEIASFAEYVLPEAIKSAFPQWATGDILDYHAGCRGLVRKNAEKATVVVTVTGTEGTKIPAGTEFSTESTDDTDAISFLTDADAVIPAGGTIDLPCTAMEAGTSGNVAANTITLQMSEVKNGELETILNKNPGSGGTDLETDEELQLRCYEFDRNADVSFVGSTADYLRWAEEVPGVGFAKVVPASGGTGKVTVIITDKNGDSASDDLRNKVLTHIMGTSLDDPQRLAPVGATLVVETNVKVDVTVSATVELETDYTIDAIKKVFLPVMNQAIRTASVLRVSEIGSLLINLPGVTDYTGLKINGGTDSVTLTSNQYAAVSADNLTLTLKASSTAASAASTKA